MHKLSILKRLFTILMTLSIIGVLEVSAAWSTETKVRGIAVNEGQVLLNFTTQPFNHSCTVRDGTYIVGGTSENVDKVTALASQALLKSRSVLVASNGACSAGGYPVLTGLTLK
jgi:hypothetical protein